MSLISEPSRPIDRPMAAVAVFGLLAFLDSLFNSVWPGNGIHGSEGALLVVVSTLLLTAAALVIATGWVRVWLRSLLQVLIVLDFAGTGLAAYFLEAWLLLGLVVLALLAWFTQFARPASLNSSRTA